MKIRLASGRDKPVRFGHPWIFSGAIAALPDRAGIADVFSAGGELLGQGFYTPHARLAVRMLTHMGEPPFTPKTIEARIARAIDRRHGLIDEHNDSVRLVFAESDFLPGLVVDKLASTLSAQFNSAFAEAYREPITAALQNLINPERIIDTSDNEARNREGLPAIRRMNNREECLIQSGGIRFAAAIGSGQKTGFYLDQRENRAIVAGFTNGKRVLDAFCYSGGFSLACLKAGAQSVTAIDSSADALALLKRNAELNAAQISPKGRLLPVEADVFTELRKQKSDGKKYDVIVLDPPKLAPSRSHAAVAEKAYKDLNLQGLHLAAEGAILATFSCSGAMTHEKLRQVLHYAAHDAGRQVQLLQPLVQANDHPVLLSFPESEYLRGYLCRVL